MEDVDVKQASFEGWANPSRLAYIAGLFDGEGCVSISRKKSTGVNPSYGLNVSVSNCHRGVLELLQRIYGGYVKHYIETRPNQRNWFTWQLSGGKMAASFLADIRPYSIIKAEEIDLALEFALRVTPKTFRLTGEEVFLREGYKTQLSALKRRCA